MGVTVADVETAVTRFGFSRFPVHDESGDVAGYIHVKDTLYATSDQERDAPIPAWRIRGMAQVRQSDDLEDVLALMQQSGTHLALVLADGGTTAVGVVFLEDILEELVGEVRDSMQRRGK